MQRRVEEFLLGEKELEVGALTIFFAVIPIVYSLRWMITVQRSELYSMQFGYFKLSQVLGTFM